MTALNSAYKDRQFLAVIGDELTRCGLRDWFAPSWNWGIIRQASELCLISLKKHVTQPPDSQKNFFVVGAKTEVSTIEQAFVRYTQDHKDIVISNAFSSKIAERIRNRVDSYTDCCSKDPEQIHPYDPEKESVLKRAQRLFGASRM